MECFLAYAEAESDASLLSRAETLIRKESQALLRRKPFNVEKILQELRGKPQEKVQLLGSQNEFLNAEAERVLVENMNKTSHDYEEDERYQVKEEPKGKEASDVAAWAAAVKHNLIVLENLENKAMNMELEVEFGPVSWKIYAQTLERLTAQAEATAANLSSSSMQVNQERRAAHLGAMEQIQALKTQWVEYTDQIRALRKAMSEQKHKRKQSDTTLSHQPLPKKQRTSE